MNYQHQELKNGKWNMLSLMEQMANVGSEVIRAINWKEKKNLEYSRMAYFRALELIDLTISDPKNKERLREITRVRETLVDYFSGANIYRSNNLLWQHYFLPFNFAARRNVNG